ncbi:TPA: transcriptional regulator ChbR, partial [Klebsiella pneumoniae subsp. pneumoniae]|nr:transcriptional regulator ChbR [Klebsiella pneumoniae subsp. pneumoniae]
VGISRRFFEKHYLPLLPFGLVASQVYAVQSAFLGYVESVIASLNFRETEFDEFIELVSFYVINRLRHYREEPVADVTPQWLKNTVEAMHDKLKFGEGALENMVRLSGKTQEYLTRATQRYYGKTPMQIINDIRINFAKKQLEITNYSVTDIAYESGYSSPSLFIKTFKKLTSFTPSSYRKHLTSIN